MTKRAFRRPRLFRRRPPLPWPVWIALVVAVLIASRFFQPAGEPFSFEQAGPYRVERVIDGDTLALEGDVRVRLIGVDTPETVHPDRPVEPLGHEAAEFVREHVEGQRVRLEFDKERRDRYGRVLAYVYRWEDDWLLNEELIRAGYSRAVLRYPYSAAMKRRFREAEAFAREEGRGLWARREAAGAVR